jgi:predicted DNA-binding transcriptional regulator AlpA
MDIATPLPPSGDSDEQLSAAIAEKLSEVLPGIVAGVIEQEYALEHNADPIAKVKAARFRMSLKRLFSQLRDEDRLVSMDNLPELVGMSRRWILDQVRLGNFPEPIRASARKNVWRMSAIQQWIDDFEHAQRMVEKPTNICQKSETQQ